MPGPPPPEGGPGGRGRGSDRLGPDGRGGPSGAGGRGGQPGAGGRGGPPGGEGRGRPPRSGDPGGPQGGRPEERSSTEKAVNLLEPLVKEHPNVPEYQLLLACCFRDQPPQGGPGGPGGGGAGGRGGQQGGAGGGGGGLSGTKNSRDRAIDLLRKLATDYPKVPDYRYELCETLTRVGFSPRPDPKDSPGEGLKMLKEAVGLSENLMKQYPAVPLYTAAHANVRDKLGVKLLEQGKLDDAYTSLKTAVELQWCWSSSIPRWWFTGFLCR